MFMCNGTWALSLPEGFHSERLKDEHTSKFEISFCSISIPLLMFTVVYCFFFNKILPGNPAPTD